MKIGKLHKSCSTLTLSRFIDVLVNGKLKSLVVYGWFSHKVLAETWNAIFQEYSELTNDNAQTHLLNTLKEHAQLAHRVDIVQMLITSLVQRSHPDIIAALRKFGFRQKFTDVTMEKDVLAVIAKLKMWIFRANELQEQLKATQDKKQAVKSSDFSDVIAELGAFQGYHINPSEITVAEYVAVLNRYKKHLEDGKRRKNNRVN